MMNTRFLALCATAVFAGLAPGLALPVRAQAQPSGAAPEMAEMRRGMELM
ncbi:MAG: hypothetical protein IH616_13820, partial [Gemmatimonadales bacterium]|nr:hypothetical protein [Gemmatimonadales bacterium]